MKTYVSFLEDRVVLDAIDRLYEVYRNAYSRTTIADLKRNVIDPFKFCFDAKFLNNNSVAATIDNEFKRQSDKSINNAIGSFHQFLIGNIEGFSETPQLTCDVMKNDMTILAEIKNKYNTMNARSQAGVFEELSNLASAYPRAICYLVEVIPKNPAQPDQEWHVSISGTLKHHPRVRKISARDFYAMATNNPLAFDELCNNLPSVIDQFLLSIPPERLIQSNSTATQGSHRLDIAQLFKMSLFP